MEGWIKTYRKLEHHWIWSNEKYLKAWLWFLFRANYNDNKALIDGDVHELKKGEFITSLYKISEATGLSNQSTRTFLTLLQKDKMIEKISTNKLTKITICNYDIYQDQQQTNNKPTTNQQQTNNKRATTEKNNKKEKNKRNIIPPSFEMVKEYCEERNNKIDPQRFIDSNSAKGWMIGKNKMVDWQAAIRTWERNNFNNNGDNKHDIEWRRKHPNESRN